MGRRHKLERFAQIKTFPNFFEPNLEVSQTTDFKLKGNWSREYFKNNNPITLELGCGKGEYTVGLAVKYPERNFIGIDIKGARMWKGADYGLKLQLSNVAFVRFRIEFIEKLFDKSEVSEIWITFPDPFPKKPANRLTSSFFINRYNKILVPEGLIHLKTDSRQFHEYTLSLLQNNNVTPEIATKDLYSPGQELDEILSLKTFYEQKFLEEGKPITYLRFRKAWENDFAEKYKPWE